jgi:hypothetical protein
MGVHVPEPVTALPAERLPRETDETPQLRARVDGMVTSTAISADVAATVRAGSATRARNMYRDAAEMSVTDSARIRRVGERERDIRSFGMYIRGKSSYRERRCVV